MVLTPTAMISSIKNDEIEPVSLTKQEKVSTPYDDFFEPQVIELKLDPLDFLGYGYDEGTFKIEGLEFTTSLIETFYGEESTIIGGGRSWRLTKGDSPWNIGYNHITNATLEIEYEFVQDYGLILDPYIESYTMDGVDHTTAIANIKYIPTEIVERGNFETLKFINSHDFSYDDENVFTEMQDGEAYFSLDAKFGDYISINPVLLHVTWPDEYNMKKRKANTKADLFYKNLDADNYKADIKVKTKKRKWFQENYMQRAIFQNLITKDFSFSSEFTLANGDKIRVQNEDIYNNILHEPTNLITNTTNLENFDLLDLEYFAAVTSYTTYRYDLVIDPTEDPIEEFTNLMDSYFSEDNFIIEESAYNSTEDIWTMKDGSVFWPSSSNIEFNLDEAGQLYISIPFIFSYSDRNGEWSWDMDDYRLITNYIRENLSAEQFTEIIDNTEILFDTEKWIDYNYGKNPFENSYYDDTLWFTSYKFLEMYDSNGNLRTHIITTGEMILVGLALIVALLLILLIVLLLKDSSDEGKHIEIVKSKGGDE